VADVLDKLNVDTTETPRVDSDGDELPSNYAPFGTKVSTNRFAELALIGVPVDDASAVRSAAAADFDGDGLDEIAVVYQLDGDVELIFIDDADAGYAISSPTRVDRETVQGIFIAAADFDGDVDVDLAVGLVSTLGDAEINIVDNTGGGFAYNGVRVAIPRRTLPMPRPTSEAFLRARAAS